MVVNLREIYDNEIVSVIIPVYNSGRYITETIESALNQTYNNIEIVLVDDCSKDNSREIIERFMNMHSNIVYHLQEKNGGAALARNKALDLAKGRYVAFLDSDDLWYPEKIEKQLQLMQNKKIAFCYTAYEMVDGQGIVLKNKTRVIERAEYKNLLKNTVISTPTVMIDRNITGDLRMPNRRTGQDYAYWLLLLKEVKLAYGLNESLVTVRRRSGSLSRNKFQNIVDVWEIQTKIENIPRMYALYNTLCYIFNSLIKRLF